MASGHHGADQITAKICQRFWQSTDQDNTRHIKPIALQAKPGTSIHSIYVPSNYAAPLNAPPTFAESTRYENIPPAANALHQIALLPNPAMGHAANRATECQSPS